MPLPIAVEITPAEAPREHVTVLLAACGRASADTECVPAADVPANGSSAVALVTWTDASHVVIEVGVRKEGRPEWRSKKLEFRSSDAELERWRTIGFVVGVLSRDESTLPAPSEASPSGPSPSPSAPHSSAPSGAPANESSSSEPSGSSHKEPAASASVKPPEAPTKAAENTAPSSEREPPRRTRPERREGPEPRKRPTITLVEEDPSERTRSRRFGVPGGTLDVGAALGPAMEGIRFGGVVRAGIRLMGPLRAVLAGRYLDRPMGAERLGGRWISGVAGLGIDVLNEPLALTITADARGEYFEARAELESQSGSAGAFLPGVGLGLNTAWMATRGFGLFLGIDGSAMLRNKRIELRKGEEVATDSALNFSGEAGFRLRLW